MLVVGGGEIESVPLKENGEEENSKDDTKEEETAEPPKKDNNPSPSKKAKIDAEDEKEEDVEL